jgi:hypothetical protein
VTDEELLAATHAALASLALDPRPALPPLPPGLTEKEGRLPGAAEVLGSQVRAGGFLLRKRAVHHADRNPLVARAARIYLDRTSPSARLPEG